MTEYLAFDPFPGFHNPHAQTILGAALIFGTEPTSIQQLVHLPDGDKISLEITTPKNWKPTDETVILIHGLCGSHQSPNIVRTAKRLIDQGVRAVRFNLRGCGSGRGHARKMYHAGLSGDILEAVLALKRQHPDSPLSIAGFSLGAQLTLRLAGELGERGPSLLKQVIAVSPPVNIRKTKETLSDARTLFYQYVFWSYLRDHVEALREHPDQDRDLRFPLGASLTDFSQHLIVPSGGFKDLEEYYETCSTIPLVSQIAVPCKILFAEDDPLICSKQLDELVLPNHVSVFKTKQGGHLGFLADPRQEKGFFWLDTTVVDWLTI